MKVEVMFGFFAKSSKKAANDLYTLDIKIIDGKSVLLGQTYVCKNDPQLSFKIKSLPVGGYDFQTKTFPIVIEIPKAAIEGYQGKIFVSE